MYFTHFKYFFYFIFGVLRVCVGVGAVLYFFFFCPVAPYAGQEEPNTFPQVFSLGGGGGGYARSLGAG